MTTIVINGIPLALGGFGLGVYAHRLIQLLGSIPNIHPVILLPGSHSISPTPDLPGTVVHIPGWNVPPGSHAGNLYWNQRLACHARRHFPNDPYLCPSPSAAFLGPRKTIIVFHDVIYRRFPRYLGKWFIRKWLLLLAEHFAAKAWKVVTVSEFSKKELVTLTRTPENKITVIPNWIEEEFIEKARTTDPASIRAKYKLPERFWLYVGGYDYRKNVEFLIEAYAEALKQAPCPPLVLAGRIPTDISKPFCDVLGAIAQSGIPTDSILMPGFIEDADLPGLYKAADLFLFPSLMEGFGYTPLEALAAGTPVIAADIPSLRENALFNTLLDPKDGRFWIQEMVTNSQKSRAPTTSLPSHFLPASARASYIRTLTEDPGE